MKTVSLSTRQVFYLLLLVRPLEVEARQIRPSLHLALPHLDDVPALAHFLIYGVVFVELATLVDISDLYGVADRQRPAVGLFRPRDHPEQSRLSRTVRADNPDDSTTRQRERKVVEQDLVAVRLLQSFRDHYIVAEPGRGWNDDLVLHHFLVTRGAGKLLVLLDTRLALRLPRSRRHPHPLQLALESSLPC